MKKLLAMFLALILGTGAMLGLAVSVSAESLYIRKIVSVVYDDSGSMKGDRWAYANYAMQMFCGMLNSEDQLYVTYMSRPAESQKIDLTTGGIQPSVDSIRTHTGVGQTPYASVDTASKKLENLQDTNPNTQYWLVVITDGGFNDSEETLDKAFGTFTQKTMPNGTKPQVIFLGIDLGENVDKPTNNPEAGIYLHEADDATEIIAAMGEMADKISGRTRLSKKDIKKVNDNTIQVSSSIPLLNIAVFSQGSDAKITKAEYSGEMEIPITRQASLSYPGYKDLVGGAYLLGDSQSAIGKGKYTIVFDKKIDLDDVIVLFEPALEIRMTVICNGEEVTDLSTLQQTREGDRISVSCKIFEMGTDNEIDTLPPGTQLQITVSENGSVVATSKKGAMELENYVLNPVETEIQASLVIDVFNIVEDTETFTPGERRDYTIEAAFVNGTRSVRYDDIAGAHDLAICFTVLENDVPLTDPEAVKALQPQISGLADGNSGDITYTNDGKILFTPNRAAAPAGAKDSYNVTVTCTLENGISASETYTVLLSRYEVKPGDGVPVIKKTGFYDNQEGVTFTIIKDGVQLTEQEVQAGIFVDLNEEHSHLQTRVSVDPDGTIHVVPYTDEEHILTFWNWWTNWVYYFRLPGEDVIVTLNHAYGSASASIDVVEEELSYRILCVYLPLLLELIALTLLVTWIILIVTKPRYLKSATLYVGSIRYNADPGTHTIRDFRAVKLDKFNKIKKGNGRLKFKKTADIVSANGIRIRADHGGRIICEMYFPWYKGKVDPADIGFVVLKNPKEVADYIEKHKKLEINEFVTTETVEGEYNRSLAPASPRIGKYIVVPDSGNGVAVVDDKKVIKSGKIFIYVND